MIAKAGTAVAEATQLETKNDRFKKSFGSRLWSSMIAATVFHFMLFYFWPTQTAADTSFTADELEVIDVLPEIEIPPPPEAISRPATPVMALTEIDDDITIAPTTFADNPPDLSPPPTDDGGADLSGAPVFTPMTVRPEVRNRSEVEAALTRLYPAVLRDSGIGGTVMVWFLISEEGTVVDRRIFEGSGHTQLDEAALEVADIFRFTPALYRDEVIPVWTQFPIIFQVEN